VNWYLSDGTNTLNLGSNCTELKLGGSKRSYKTDEFVGANGGVLKGFGNYSAKSFEITFQLRASNGQVTYHNSTRTLINQWFTRMVYESIYLYVVTSDTSPVTKRTLVFCTNIGDEKISYQRGFISKSYTVISPTGYFEDTTAATGSLAITDSSVNIVSVTNAGDIDTPIKLKFTPTGNETYFQVEIFDTHGVKLGATYFNAGNKIIYDTNDNSLTIAGQEVNLTNYLISGSTFNLSPGINLLYVQCSGAGLFEYEYNSRYI
jgi:hypothetical protein